MWKLSELGGEAEGCFLRGPQTEYYLTPQANEDLLSYYPDVSVPVGPLVKHGFISSVQAFVSGRVCG